MRTIFIILLAIVSFSSCVTQRKVDSWLNEHPLYEAKRCADKFPSVTTGVDVKVDSAAFKKSLDSIIRYLDGLTYHGSVTIPGDQYIEIPSSSIKDTIMYIPENMQRQLNQLRDMIRRLPAVVIDTTRTVKDSAEVSALRLTIQLWRDSSNYHKGMAVDYKDKATTAIKELRAFKWGIAALIGFVVVVLILAFKNKFSWKNIF